MRQKVCLVSRAALIRKMVWPIGPAGYFTCPRRPAPSTPAVADWEKSIGQVFAVHFFRAAGPRAPAAFSPDEPEHRVGVESITASAIEDEKATVRTVDRRRNRFFEYQLVQEDGEWRIAKISHSSKSPPPFGGSPPLVPPSDRAAILAAASEDASLAALGHRCET